ncbi:hypothetical protein BGZ82_008878 [Podila clonocystis]|nr:hypothetical protein BGZ82_008878 [Podila clonocystis]
MYKHVWSLSQPQSARFQTELQRKQTQQQTQEQRRGQLARKRGMEEEDENEKPKKRIGWSGTRPDELSISSVGLSQPYQVAELQQQPHQQVHHQQSRSIYGFDSPVSAPSTPVFESEPFVHLHPPQQVHPSTQEPTGLGALPTWAMEDVDLVRGVTTGLAASTLAYDDESISQEVEDGSLYKQQQVHQPHQDTNLSQYYYVMGFRANCDKCQRRERGHFAHLVERPEKA